ncbi:MAG: glycoside hydrolase family 2 protein [Planctomycetota bacterium]
MPTMPPSPALPSNSADAEQTLLVKSPLTRNWTVQALGGEALIPDEISDQRFEATVPGCVHTDLLRANVLEDPIHDRNETKQAWIGKTAWRYTHRFTHVNPPAPGTRCDLVCEGLDTVAELKLNGRVIGHAENMHLGYRFDLADALQVGDNLLTIDFAAPLSHAMAVEREFGPMPHEGHGSNPQHPHNMIRKMACNFGWDWGPAFITSGVWRPIYLEEWTYARLDQVRPQVTRVDADLARVEVIVRLEMAESSVRHAYGNTESLTIRATLFDPDGAHVAEASLSAAAGDDEATLALDVTRPKRWWPVGYGSQPLYTLRVELFDPGTDQTLDRWQRRIGLRAARLVTDADPESTPLGQGSTFHLEINGKRVYCKGANWIPDDCFPSRVTPARYRSQVQRARDANMNMLRVWGGGIYEDRAFYEACDELGVMVWQDFMMACACYHEVEPFFSLIEAEAHDNVARLTPHPSVVLWNGCNENIWGVYEWGEDWRAMRESERGWGLKYYLDVFPRVVAQLDPVTPYWPASPYAGDPDVFPNVEEHGNCHIWDVWNGQGDARNYLNHAPRFASEFGFHGPPTFATLERVIPHEQRRFDSPSMVHHNRHAGGQALANERMADYFVPPDDFDDWLFLAQVVQARSLALGVEWFRALSPWNSGALFWQFNDCWPVASWSAVDGNQRPKPLWYAARNFFADRLITIRPDQPIAKGDPIEHLAVYLHNDTDTAWSGEVHVASHALNGHEGESFLTTRINVGPRETGRVQLPFDLQLAQDRFLTASIGSERAFWWPHPDRVMPYPDAELDVDVKRSPNGYALTVLARTVVRDLCVFPDRLDPNAQISDQLLTLLPGERATLMIRTDRALSPRALTSPPVLQCVNAFGL